MRLMLLLVASACTGILPVGAFAADPLDDPLEDPLDDPLDEGDEEKTEEEKTEEPKDDGKLDPLELPEGEVEEQIDEDFVDGEETDLLGDDMPVGPVSADTAEMFRQKQIELKRLEPDEQVQGWEDYLAQYPNSAFAKRIQGLIDEAMDELYASGIEGDVSGVDPMDQELRLSQGLQMDNIDPRTRLRVGFEWGLPAWLNLLGDFEWAPVRKLSVHAGVKRMFTGFNVEYGGRWAIVKSRRTNTVFTLLVDSRLNTNPFFPAVRPQLGIGKRFGGKLDAQLQGGTDLEFREELGVRVVGGANLTYQASPSVWLFGESGVHMKDVLRAGGHFRFNTVTFGMKFFPRKRRGDIIDQDIDVNLGATVPYSTNYYSFHYGSVMGQANMFL